MVAHSAVGEKKASLIISKASSDRCFTEGLSQVPFRINCRSLSRRGDLNAVARHCQVRHIMRRGIKD